MADGLEKAHCRKIIKAPIIIVGAGPAGMLAAIALAEKGQEAIIIGEPPHEKDLRTTALMAGGVDFLNKLQIWPHIIAQASPIAELEIIDATRRLIRSRPLLFRACDIGRPFFGYNIPNESLNKALAQKLAQAPNITFYQDQIKHYEFKAHQEQYPIRLLAPQKPNAPKDIMLYGERHIYCAKLVIAGDGKNSLARQAAGIEIKQWSYQQIALIANFAHQYPHQDRVREFHKEDGPCTQIPLAPNQSSLVYIRKQAKARQLAALKDEDFAQHLEKCFASSLGKIRLLTPIQSWPLSSLCASSYGKNNILLLGEAAHLFPPLGAQGFNLTIRDIQDASQIIAQQSIANRDKITELYNNKRQKDIAKRSYAVELLNRSLLSNSLTSQLIRSIGAQALNNIPALSRALMRQGLEG